MLTALSTVRKYFPNSVWIVEARVRTVFVVLIWSNWTCEGIKGTRQRSSQMALALGSFSTIKIDGELYLRKGTLIPQHPWRCYNRRVLCEQHGFVNFAWDHVEGRFSDCSKSYESILPHTDRFDQRFRQVIFCSDDCRFSLWPRSLSPLRRIAHCPTSRDLGEGIFFPHMGEQSRYGHSSSQACPASGPCPSSVYLSAQESARSPHLMSCRSWGRSPGQALSYRFHVGANTEPTTQLHFEECLPQWGLMKESS